MIETHFLFLGMRFIDLFLLAQSEGQVKKQRVLQTISHSLSSVTNPFILSECVEADEADEAVVVKGAD